MKPYSLLIITDNQGLRERLEAYFSKMECIHLLPTAEDGSSGVDKAALCEPDMILLDMLMPQMDGIAVLRTFRAKGICQNTKIFAMSTLKSEAMIRLGESLGVTYQIQMPTDESLIFSRMMDFSLDRDGVQQLRSSMRENDLSLRIDEIISELFRSMGCPANLAGYYQAKTTINYWVRNINRVTSLSKEVYPYAASIHGADPRQIERNIRNFIEVTWIRGNIKAHQEIFGNTVQPDVGKPTNKEFIANIAEYTVRRLRKGI